MYYIIYSKILENHRVCIVVQTTTLELRTNGAGGEPRRLVCVGSFYVLPPYRTRSSGRRLTERAMRDASTIDCFAYGSKFLFYIFFVIVLFLSLFVLSLPLFSFLTFHLFLISFLFYFLFVFSSITNRIVALKPRRCGESTETPVSTTFAITKSTGFASRAPTSSVGNNRNKSERMARRTPPA